MITINGKQYPLWSQFVENKEKWIGGILWDLEYGNTVKTKIVDIQLKPNGNENAFFEVVGEDYGCGFSTEVGGISPHGTEENCIQFCGYGGHTWRIYPKA